jgi:hypothetical protein
MKRFLTKEFWVEYITIYISIIIVTITIQIVILRLDVLLLAYCLAKSIFTTIPNVAAIMYGRNKEIISKNRFREALLFVFSSLPYLEIFLISGYERNWETIGKVIVLYFIAYFIMGLFNRPYLETIKKIVCLPEKIVKKTIRRKKRNAL